MTTDALLSVKEAALNVLKVPIAYAAILGLILNTTHTKLPLILERSIIEIAADASIPLMLALLGLQLSRISFKTSDKGENTLAKNWPAVIIATSLRLLIAQSIFQGHGGVSSQQFEHFDIVVAIGGLGVTLDKQQTQHPLAAPQEHGHPGFGVGRVAKHDKGKFFLRKGANVINAHGGVAPEHMARKGAGQRPATSAI